MFKKLFCITIFLLLPCMVYAGPDQKTADKIVVMETTLGTIKIELFDEKAPITVKNFRRYVREKFYDGLIFHRVIPGFVVQGGGFMPGMKSKKNHPPIINEADNGLLNKRGTLSMARSFKANSATSQFFINVKNNSSLDHRSKTDSGYGYAVFGKVVEGMDVVDKIVFSPTKSVGRFKDVPRQDIVILKAYEE